MTRLPVPGEDSGAWGEILNEYLLESHTSNGSLKAGIVKQDTIAAGAVSEFHLDIATRDKLNTPGPQGPQGIQGEPGPAGAVGSSGVVVLGVSDPDPSPPLDGVLYVRLTGDIVDATPPTVPSGLTVATVTSNSIGLTWSASSDDSNSTMLYQVRIDTGTPVSVTVPEYTFASLSANTMYTFDVRAGDSSGNWSAWSTPLQATTTTGGPAILFSDDFNRADGPAGYGWDSHHGASAIAISSNQLQTNWGYSFGRAFHGGFPKAASVRATFVGPIANYQGIFHAYTSAEFPGIKFFQLEGSWVIGSAVNWDSYNVPVSFINTPTPPFTSLRLDFDGTTITAFINETLVYTAPISALGIPINPSAEAIYYAGYCGEGKAPYMDSFQVYGV